MKTKTIYICDVCKAEFLIKESAQKCEAQPPLTPKFKVGDMASLKKNRHIQKPEKIIEIEIVNSSREEWVNGDKDIDLEPDQIDELVETSMGWRKTFTHKIAYNIYGWHNRDDNFPFFTEDEITDPNAPQKKNPFKPNHNPTFYEY